MILANMMRWIWFAALLILLIAGLVFTQTHQVDATVGPNALLYLVADTQRELTRLPMHYTRIPDADEIKIGDRIAKSIDAPQQNDETRTIEAYLQTVGNRVAAHAYRKLPYRFHYIPNRYFINAFALPGGHVFMGAGLMNLMENEDELAAVLGHEIEHIDHYHCAERLQLERAMRKIPFLELASLPIEVFQAGYSKDQELEADREGTELAVMAGYAPEGAIQIFAEFQKLEDEYRGPRKATTPQDEVSRATIQVLTGYFASHPASADRIAKIRDLMAEKKWTARAVRPLEIRYIYLAHQAEALLAVSRFENAKLEKANYEKAAELATTSLQLHARYPLALAALAKAKCALRDFTAAAVAYKDLLPIDPVRADTVRAFADARGAAALTDKKLADAGQFAAFSLELQPNNPESLKFLAEVKLEQGDKEAALDAGRKLAKLYPQTATQLMQYSREASDRAYQLHEFERAVFFAAYELELDANKPPSMRLQVARSEFALARFADSARDYRALAEDYVHTKTAMDTSTMQGYADVLGCLPGHAEAAREFERVLKPLTTTDETDTYSIQVKIEHAGLMILAGDDTMARQLSDRPFTAGGGAYTPESLARLGWWYYRAGKYDAADKLLRRFLSVRPGDPGLQSAMGWVAIERNASAEAMRLFGNVGEEEAPWRTARAGYLIAQWRLRQTDDAAAGFEQWGKSRSDWNNPTWVKAFYGPQAVQSVQELRAEVDRRIAARRGH